jgi:hypothetical protein
MNQPSFESQRYELDARVRLEREGYPAVDATLHDISLTGMFVSCVTTYPAGTRLRFQLVPNDRRFSPVEGIAQIAWRRQLAAGPHRPSGMGCALSEVADDGLQRIREWILASPEQVIPRSAPDRSSLTTELSRFRVSAVQHQKNTVPHDMGVYRANQIVSRKAAPRWRSLLPLVVVGFLFVAVVLAYYQPWKRGLGRSADNTAASNSSGPGQVAPLDAGQNDSDHSIPAESTSEPVADRPSRPSEPTGEVVPGGPGQASATEPPTDSADQIQSVRLTVRQWAAAWSAQDVDQYLSYYSDQFEPPSGETRAVWAASRRERLTRPGYIRVSMSDLVVEGTNPSGPATARFVQEYEAPNYRDVVRKELLLRNENGTWRIHREVSAPP